MIAITQALINGATLTKNIKVVCINDSIMHLQTVDWVKLRIALVQLKRNYEASMMRGCLNSVVPNPKS